MWPWLKTIAVRLSIDYARQRRPEPCEDPCDGRSVTDDTGWLEEGPILEAALAGLPARQRVALKLRYLDDWSPAEAAEALGLTRPAFDQLLFRARGKLRSEYRRVCGDQPAAVYVLFWPLLAVLSRVRHAAWRAKVAAQSASLPVHVASDALAGLVVAAAVGAATLGASLGTVGAPDAPLAFAGAADLDGLAAASGFAAMLPSDSSDAAPAPSGHDSWSLEPAPVIVPDYPDVAARLARLSPPLAAPAAPPVAAPDAPADPASGPALPGIDAGKSAGLPLPPVVAEPKLPMTDLVEGLGI